MTPLTTKAAEIRAGLSDRILLIAETSFLDQAATDDLREAAALIEQQAAELAERDAEISLTESLVADERKMRFTAEAERDELLREKERMGALVDACSPYLKEGETPRERMDRDFKDAQALTELLAEARRDRDIHNGHRRMAEAKLMALGSGGVVGGCALVPVEPTEDMLAATCDANGRMRVLEFTQPEERSAPFLVPRYAYRAMIQAARSANSALENGPAGLADAHSKSPDPTPSQSERIAVLEAALRPFVALADSYLYRYETQPGVFRESHQDDPDDRAVYGINRVEITTGDFRRARSALAPLGEE